jgi:flagellar biosynthesis protein FlhA
VRLQDNMSLPKNRYQIKIKGIEVGSGEVYAQHFLVLINGSDNYEDLPGFEVKEPIHKLPARWIKDEYKAQALERQAVAISPATIIGSHLSNVVENNITDLFSAGIFNKLLENVDKSALKIYNEIVPAQVSQSFILRVCANLLEDGISIRDLTKIIENIAEVVELKDVNKVTEHVRESLGKYICHDLAKAGSSNILKVLSISSDWEVAFERALIGDDNNKILTVGPDIIANFISSLKDTLNEHESILHIVTSSILRPHIQKLLKKSFPEIRVLSYAQLNHNFPVDIVGEINRNNN